ncbi:MAG: hypothetical protein C0398_07630 [Coprothermobacter sp.]|jgi:hypothetical protein|nr:hypothetical protein [Coprothermobacter sp.]
MELNKERGPIYSRYDRDRSTNYSAVIDYAAPPLTREEIEFMMAHKITPTEAEPGDIRTHGANRYQQAETPLPAFLQLLTSSMAQRTPSQTASLLNRNARKNQAQSKAALIGIIIWVLFIVAAMLISVLGR